MPLLESSIDDLYQQPLEEFIAARTALARTVKGDEAKRVKQLPKPTAAAWAVNQVYWQARPVYDRLTKSGRKLREAQIGALNGRPSDVRGAAEQHRAALSQAVAEASRLASSIGLNPNTDDLSRTFEALSLEIKGAEAAGRVTRPMQPAGFEALAGIVVKEPVQSQPPQRPEPVRAQPPAAGQTAASKRIAEEEDARRRQRQEEEAAARRKQAALAEATAAVARAEAAEAASRTEWDRCKRELEMAKQALARLEK